jgi:hypothetical protein
MGLVDYRDRAGDAGRDERHRRDARRGEGEISRRWTRAKAARA